MKSLNGLPVHLIHQGGSSKSVRCVWVPDVDYIKNKDNTCLNCEAEIADNGHCANCNHYVLGCIVQRCCRCCGQWSEVDSCYGIVTEADEASLKRFARDNMDLSAKFAKRS